MTPHRFRGSAIGIALFAAFLASVGCVAQPDAKLVKQVEQGEFGEARVYLAEKVAQQTPEPGEASESSKNWDRDHLLNRLRLLMVTLADGYPHALDEMAKDTFAIYRTQGINDDKTVASVVINEDLKFWKGEPFEQAMGLSYIAMYYGSQGQWGNMRAASEASLFQLRDFGTDEEGNTYDAVALAQAAAQDEEKLEDYDTRPSNFTLGYLLSAVANHQMGRYTDMNERLDHALRLDSGLRPVVDRIRRGDYNTVFVVDYGRGPQKIGTGPDRAVAKFVPLTPSTDHPLVISAAGSAEQRHPVALDLNEIATDLMWNNLEDVRLAKSYLGSALVAAGAGTAAYGFSSGSDAASYAGLAMMVVGAVAKAGAHADTRYCEIMPQRVYLAVLNLEVGDQPVGLSIDGMPQTEFLLPGVERDSPGEVALRYVRLLNPPTGPATPAAPLWATELRTIYANAHEPDAGELKLPYILGGHCVRPPSYDALMDYQRAGYLQGVTLGQLEELYLAEGIEWEARPGRQPDLHVLEGGKSLVAPQKDSSGYARLFRQPHPPYRPHSDLVRQMKQSLPVSGAQTASR